MSNFRRLAALGGLALFMVAAASACGSDGGSGQTDGSAAGNAGRGTTGGSAMSAAGTPNAGGTKASSGQAGETPGAGAGGDVTSGQATGGEPTSGGAAEGGASAGAAGEAAGGQGPLECAPACALAGGTCDAGHCSAIELLKNGAAWEATYAADVVYFLRTNSSPVTHYTLTGVTTTGTPVEKTIWDADGTPGDGVVYADALELHWAVTGNPSVVLKKAISDPSLVNPTVVFQPTGAPRFLTVHGSSYYFMTGMDGGPATLFSRPLSAAKANTGTEIMKVDQHYVSAFVVGASSIYWVARHIGVAPAHLATVPLAGGNPVDVPDAEVFDSAPLALQGDTLFFVRRSGSKSVLNGIYRFEPGDSTVTQLVQQDDIGALAVDSQRLYYSGVRRIAW